MLKQIIIGTGPVGLAVMDELVENGEVVTLINTTGTVSENLSDQVTIVKGDITDPLQVQTLCAEADVIYMCAMPPYTQWTSKFLPLMEGLIGGLAYSKARLVFADNLYMYGPVSHQPLTEDLPYQANGPKGAVRGQIVHMLLGAKQRLNLDVKIARASDFFGPRVRVSALGDRVFQSAISKKSIEVLGNPELAHSFTYIRDFAKALVTLGKTCTTSEVIFHVPNTPDTSVQVLVKQMERELGHRIKIKATGQKMVGFLGMFVPIFRELKEVMYQWEHTFEVNHNKYLNTFGQSATPLNQSIHETLNWFKSQQVENS